MPRGKRKYRRGRRTKKRGFSSWSIGKKILAIFGGTLALVATAGVALVASKLTKIETQKIDPEKLSVSEEAKERGTGYLNVALFGVDSREGKIDEGTLSDTIMIASLNRATLEVKITSVYRDTLLEQSDGTLNKANSAYGFGGPEAAVAMLNKNLDMNIEHYLTVDFNALIDVIDAVGGIDVDVQPEECTYLTGYVVELQKITGKESMGVETPGLQTLNGMQATAYARIRYTAGDDFRRTERQREVLQKVFAKLQNASLTQINKIIDATFPKVSTNFTLLEVIDYAKDIFDYTIGETTGFPFEKSTDTLNQIGSVVIPVTLDSNVMMLHQFLYGTTEGYTVSSTVANISYNISAKAGDRQPDSEDVGQSVIEQSGDTGQYYQPQESTPNDSLPVDPNPAPTDPAPTDPPPTDPGVGDDSGIY